MNWDDAKKWCANKGLTLPTVAQLSAGNSIRNIGALWNEWGDMREYGWNHNMHWTSETTGNNVKAVGMVSGYIAGRL